ncbi:hypothetical protein WA026_019817 [Henosepilachna vigintioctopunctata]|uniref:Uncharacterized protein n=1 Tax=Henosepilachna vigintioctopunctata TaxID=420089 RepID=A0AAW1VIU2_9CUCU
MSQFKELKNTFYDDKEDLQIDDEYLKEITDIQETDNTANASEEPLEKLLQKLLEMNQEKILKTTDNGTLIDLIASGLPNYIIDKIDQEKLTETADLQNELGELGHLTYEKNLELKTNKQNIREKNEKTPCSICKENEKGTRFHP